VVSGSVRLWLAVWGGWFEVGDEHGGLLWLQVLDRAAEEAVRILRWVGWLDGIAGSTP
jgi:hypothetical protein